MKLYITYKDDGPAGVCGQTVDITNPRTKLYVISGDNEEKIRAELKNLQESVNNSRTTRQNARLTDYYWEGNEWEQEDVKNISTESDVNSSDEIEVKFRSWYKGKYGSAYFGSVPLMVLLEWSKTLLNQINPKPISVEDRLPESTDCDLEGNCWWWRIDGVDEWWEYLCIMNAREYNKRICGSVMYTHWLPHWVITTPTETDTQEINND